METFRGQIMGRPRKPTAALELSGAFKRNPQRRRDRADDPVVDEPVGPPPRHLSEQARKIWNRIARSEAGTWLRVTDRDALEVYCGLKAQAETDLAGMQSSRISLLNKYQNDLGLTTTARTKVKAFKAEELEPNPFAAFK
jgi:phage terminase small subunit